MQDCKSARAKNIKTKPQEIVFTLGRLHESADWVGLGSMATTRDVLMLPPRVQRNDRLPERRVGWRGGGVDEDDKRKENALTGRTRGVDTERGMSPTTRNVLIEAAERGLSRNLRQTSNRSTNHSPSTPRPVN